MPPGLIALAIGAFGIGLTEFVIMGLLPEVAHDFGVTESAAGWLISGYALAVVVGALVLTAAATRLTKKPVLLGLIVMFIIGNALTALADDYSVAILGRIIAALCHGAFFGIGSVVAAGLVAPEKKAGAIAIMFTGLTAANVFGVPFGTVLGQELGWRSTFWAISGIGVLAFLGIALLVPRLPRPTAQVSLRSELAAFRSGQVWFSLVVTILAFGGMFGAFTYIAYTLTEVSGFATSAVPWLLGAGLVLGNWLGGRLADRANRPQAALHRSHVRMCAIPRDRETSSICTATDSGRSPAARRQSAGASSSRTTRSVARRRLSLARRSRDEIAGARRASSPSRSPGLRPSTTTAFSTSC
ncbi:MFS transporter [Microbacterium maritypicum]